MHGEHARVVLAGPFDLAHAVSAAEAIANVEPALNDCRSIQLDLGDIDAVDGTGAVLLARLLDRLETSGLTTQIATERNV